MHKKIIKLILSILLTTVCSSCNKTTYINNDNVFLSLENDLKKKFGAESYYTDIIINLSNEKITNIDLIQTKNPESLKMEGWNYNDQEWNMVSEVSLQLEKGEIRDYMFKLDDKISLEIINQLKQNIPVKSAFYISEIKIISPENGNKSSLKYQIQIYEKSNKKSEHFIFDINGNLVSNNQHKTDL